MRSWNITSYSNKNWIFLIFLCWVLTISAKSDENTLKGHRGFLLMFIKMDNNTILKIVYWTIAFWKKFKDMQKYNGDVII